MICILPIDKSIHNLVKLLSQDDYTEDTIGKYYLYNEDYSYVLSSLFYDIFNNNYGVDNLVINNCEFKFRNHQYPHNDLSGEKAAYCINLENKIKKDYEKSIEFYSNYQSGLTEIKEILYCGNFIVDKVFLNLIIIKTL